MAKDPAFLFYPGDYIAGTMHLDFICKGAYMDLLMLQFNRGHMTLDMIKHMLGGMYAQIWGQIEDKFSVEESEGIKYYYNERLRLEKSKRQKFVESRTNNKKGSNQHSKKETKSSEKKKGHMSNHMEDENINENRSIKENEIILPFDSEKFKSAWGIWKEYKKKEHNFKYKSEITEQAALNKLTKLSGGHENECYKILQYSIENGYKGFFEQKTQTGKNSNMQDYKQQIVNDINNA